MYADLLTAVQAMLVATGVFPSVICGVGAPKSGYPAVNLWLQESVDAGGKTDPLEDEQLLVQVQSYSGEEKEESYLELMGLVATAKRALNGARLPGHGAQQLKVPKFEVMRLPDNGPMVYVLRVGVRVSPSSFTTT